MSLIHSLRIWYHIQISFSLLSAHQFNVNEKSFLCGRHFLSNLLHTSLLMLAGYFPIKQFLTTLSFVQLIFKVKVWYKNYVTKHITFPAPDILFKFYLYQEHRLCKNEEKIKSQSIFFNGKCNKHASNGD